MRSIAPLPLALIALLLAVPVALAGNWAAVSVDSSSTDGWEVGAPHGLIMGLLQHGETPVNHGTVEVTLTNEPPGNRSPAPPGASVTGSGARRSSSRPMATGRWTSATRRWQPSSTGR